MKKITTYIFLIFIFGYSILNIVIKDKDISENERRKLKRFPKFSINNVMDGSYMTSLDSYSTDQAPYRDTFRNIKSLFNYKVLRKLDNNGIFIDNNYIYKLDYNLNIDSINHFIDNINNIDCKNKYIVIVPDKNYYMTSTKYPKLDYTKLYSTINKGLTSPNNIIDITKDLNKDSYYYTDTHYKQESLDSIMNTLSKELNFNYKPNYKYNTYNNFKGVYIGQSALNIKGEKLTYLSNDIIDNMKVKYLENDKLHTIYNANKLKSLDSYEVYLDGASSYIEITNNKSNNNKELVIFRDSFGSSISPLIAQYYKKITIIDNRYISSKYYNDLISLKDKDVLFIYSTLIVNNSSTLKG